MGSPGCDVVSLEDSTSLVAFQNGLAPRPISSPRPCRGRPKLPIYLEQYPHSPCNPKLLALNWQRTIDSDIHKMQAFRSTTRVVPQLRATGFPRIARRFVSDGTFEHLLVSTPKTGVGFSEYCLVYTVIQVLSANTRNSSTQPPKSPQCTMHASHPRAQSSPARLSSLLIHWRCSSYWL